VQTEGATRVKCPTCGAQMRLLKVAPDKTMIAPGYEERTFECSGCHDHVRRLVFIPPAIEPLTSEQKRLPPVRFKSPLEGWTSKGAWSRALRAAPRVNTMWVAGALIVIGLTGSIVSWGQGLKGPIGDQDRLVPKGQQAIQVQRARQREFGSFAPTATRRTAACNAARAKCF